jgi:hypothetical protein
MRTSVPVSEVRASRRNISRGLPSAAIDSKFLKRVLRAQGFQIDGTSRTGRPSRPYHAAESSSTQPEFGGYDRRSARTSRDQAERRDHDDGDGGPRRSSAQSHHLGDRHHGPGQSRANETALLAAMSADSLSPVELPMPSEIYDSFIILRSFTIRFTFGGIGLPVESGITLLLRRET